MLFTVFEFGRESAVDSSVMVSIRAEDRALLDSVAADTAVVLSAATVTHGRFR